MIKMTLKLILITGFLFSSCAFAGTVEKRYELPNHGALLMNVPSTWLDQVRRPSKELPPTIRFKEKSGEKFVILFTAMWKMPNAQPGFGSPEMMKKLVKGAIAQVSSQAEEKNIQIKTLGGKNTGYYFSATDKAPEPDGYKYMSQGVVGIDKITATFTILTNHPDSNVTKQALEMIAGARHTRKAK